MADFPIGRKPAGTPRAPRGSVDTTPPAKRAEATPATEEAAADGVDVRGSGSGKVLGHGAPPARGGGRGGANAALAGLRALEPSSRPKGVRAGAGAAAALLALTLLSTTAFAEPQKPLDLSLPPNAVWTQLPDATGPPAQSVLYTQITAKRAAKSVDAASARTDAEAKAAFDRFDAAVDHVLRLDAAGLASGRGPLDPDSPLTSGEQKQLEDALRGLFEELPVASLAPGIAAHVDELATAHGVAFDPATARVKDLGHVAGDVAKDLVDQLRREKPAVFWGTAGAVAVAVGAGSYLEGSHVLRAVGIKPEIKKSFLDGKLTAKLGLDWGKRFSDPQVHAGLSTPVHLGGLSGELGASVEAKGATFGRLEASGFSLSGSLGGVTHDGTALSTSTSVSLDGHGAVTTATVSGSMSNGPWSATAGITAWPHDDNHWAASLGVGYKPSQDVDVYLQGSRDNHGDTSVGLGVRIRF